MSSAKHPKPQTLTGPQAPTHAPLIIDVAGLSLTAADRDRLSNPLVGGVIHFARHWASREQLCLLNAEIKSLRPDLLILVDHEGGRVQRFKTDGFTHLPAMRRLGEWWLQDPLRAIKLASDVGFVLAAELRACGVDMSFAPVLDLDWGGSSVIGDRAFAADPRVVSLLAKSLVHGLNQAGMASCGKHFPGHGFVKADSHTATAIDSRSLKQILAADAAPFAWLSNVLDAVMPAHVIYPKVDDKPAGFSTRWLQDILRERLGFGGAVFSDDLSMAAARVLNGQALSYAQAACAALNAGCDLVLVCNQSVANSAVLDELLADLQTAAARGEWQMNPLSEQRRLGLLPKIEAPSWDALMRSPHYIAALESLSL
jgi:beta-N-acetylhexosaminidase